MLAASALAPACSEAQSSTSSFEVYGFAQVDYVQDFQRVNPAWDDTLRPSRIPTTDGLYGDDGQAVLGIRQSRLGVQATLANVSGADLYTKFEFDLFGVGVDEGQTTIRPRHMYGQWKNWLAGQTNSLFMDIDVFPNVIDYWGPAGMVFFRTPQIRWMPKTGATSFAVAIEKPGDDIDAGHVRTLDPTLGANVQGDEEFPDVTAQFRKGGDWGHFQIAAIYRPIGYETLGTPNNEPSDNLSGWGVDLTTDIKFGGNGKNKVMLGVVYGEGIASYMNDGGMDVAPELSTPPPVLEALGVPLTGVIAYVDLYWTSEWSSSFGYSYTEVDNTNFQTGDTFHKGQYASVNLLYSSSKQMLVGVEALWGEREDNNGATGNDTRLQLSFKYSFSSKDFK
jgi:hypothetical protein